MRCDKCNIEVTCDTVICPLCHEKLTDRTPEPLKFPKKQPAKHIHKHFTVKTIYLFISMIIFLICLTVNYMTATDYLWCYIVGLTLAYGFFLICHTIESRFSVGVKIIMQLGVIVLLLYLTQLILGEFVWITDYAMPIVLIISILVEGGFVIFQALHNRSSFISAIVISLFGYVPIILYAADVTGIFWMAITSAIVASVCIIGALTFGLTDIGAEFKKKFHF